MTTLLERAIAAYARFCLRAFILAGEALGDALIIVAYATVALFGVATVGAVLILSLLEIRP